MNHLANYLSCIRFHFENALKRFHVELEQIDKRPNEAVSSARRSKVLKVGSLSSAFFHTIEIEILFFAKEQSTFFLQ